MNAEQGEMPSDIEIEREEVENIELEPVPEKATDIEVVTFLNRHIDNPCEVEVAPGQMKNIRVFYLREARNILPKLTNPHAKRLLEMKIGEYT